MAPRKYPTLPKEAMAPGGPVTVIRRTPLMERGVEAWGLWEEHTRTITVDSTCTPRHAWKIYYHELAHVALDDSGLSNGIQDDLVEALCDALSVARMREKFG